MIPRRSIPAEGLPGGVAVAYGRVLTVLILLFLAGCGGNPRSGREAAPVYEVSRGDVTLKIVENGILEAGRSVTITSELPSNKAKIIWLVEEGSYVQKGDPLVKFDPAPFQEEIKQLEAAVREAEGVLAQVREDLRLQQVQGWEEVAALEHAVKVAELELKNLEEGQAPLQLEEAGAALKNAELEWQQADKEYRDLEEILDGGFVTRNEVEKARRRAAQARSNYELAREKIKVLKELILPADIEKARAKLAKLRDDRQKLQESLSIKKMRAQATVARARNKLAREQAGLAEVEAMLDKIAIRAPSPGLVIFNEVPVLGERRKVQIGDSVWANQGFIILPDISRMTVVIKVREVDISRVARGQRAVIEVNAFPDLTLHGQVEMIGTLARTEDNRQGAARFFTVRVAVSEFDERLRPGMTARVTLIVRELEDVVRVPVEAVFEAEEGYICFLRRESGDPARQPVVPGESDGDYVIIRRGLEAGDRILLRAPENTRPAR